MRDGILAALLMDSRLGSAVHVGAHLSAPASLTSAQLLDQLVYTGSLPSSLPILFFFFPLFILKIFKLTKKLKENIKHVHALP